MPMISRPRRCSGGRNWPRSPRKPGALQQEAESERGKTGPQVAVQGGYLYQQDRYLEPNGLAGVMLGVEWNVLDMGRVRNRANALSDKAEAVIRFAATPNP